MKHLPTVRKENDFIARAMQHPFDMHRSMNDLFEGIFKDLGGIRIPTIDRLWKESGSISPKFDISETDAAYNVKTELPGLEEKDIELTMDHDALVLKGEKKQEHEQKKKNYFLSERSSRKYYGEVPMPRGVDMDNVKATFKKGVLKVTLPKIEKARIERKSIKITSE